MSLNIMLVVLFAALLHATWNFLVKRSADKYQGMTSVVFGRVPYALVTLLLVPSISSSALGYVIVGTILHIGYQLFLLNSYKLGDLSQVYPIARGGAPFIVAIVSVVFLGVRYENFEIAALVLIGCGIISLAFAGNGVKSDKHHTSAMLAVTAGAFIAGYSLVDGLGARVAGTALGYYSLLTIINAVIYGIIINRMQPGLVKHVVQHELPISLLGGGFSFLAYTLVIWAFTKEPIALVASLRETSIIFALLFGVFILKERLSLRKAIAILCTVVGVGLFRLGPYL